MGIIVLSLLLMTTMLAAMSTLRIMNKGGYNRILFFVVVIMVTPSVLVGLITSATLLALSWRSLSIVMMHIVTSIVLVVRLVRLHFVLLD